MLWRSGGHGMEGKGQGRALDVAIVLLYVMNNLMLCIDLRATC